MLITENGSKNRLGHSTGQAGDLSLSILTPEQLEPNDGGVMVMGLAKVGQHTKGIRHHMLQSEKTPSFNHISVCVFVCLF